MPSLCVCALLLVLSLAHIVFSFKHEDGQPVDVKHHQHHQHQHQQSHSQQLSPWPNSATIQCYPYTLQNECKYLVNSTIFTPQQQEDIFEYRMQWYISDRRMVLPECRRALLWCWCGAHFPSCEINATTNTPTLTPLCGDVCNQTINFYCQPIFDALGNASILFDPAILPPQTYISTDDNDDNCIQTQIDNYFIPVSTCLPEGVPCCTGIVKYDPYPRECRLACVELFDREDEYALEIFTLVMVWIGFVISALGCLPFVLDPYARTFPSHLPLFFVCEWTDFCFDNNIWFVW